MGKGMWGVYCGKTDAGSVLWKRDEGGDCGERDVGELTVRKRLRGGDCGERDEGRTVGKGMREGTVGKWLKGGDCGERDAGRGLWGKG